MKIIAGSRASSILYNFVKNNTQLGTWIIPTNVCHFVPACILKAGCDIEIIDVNELDFCLNQEIVLEKISKNKDKYCGVLFVRTYGIEKIFNSFFKKIKEISQDIMIVDDKCLCKPNQDTISPFVDLELFSTTYAKYVEFGFGGYAKIQKELIFDLGLLDFKETELKRFEDYFRNLVYNEASIDDEGLNRIIKGEWLKSEKIDQEKYLNNIERKIREVDTTKKLLNNIYESNLPKEIQYDVPFNNWRFNILVDNKKKILEDIFSKGLFASSHYFPLSKLFTTNTTPVWERIYDRTINLFNDYRFDEEKAKRITEVIVKNI